MFRCFSLFSTSLILTLSLALSTQAEVTAKKSDDCKKVIVEIDGKPFAEYLTRSGTKPCVWPILGPTEKPMTRAYPMTELGENEKKDHIHHRSLWFTHGTLLMDGKKYNFWHEKGDSDHIDHKAFTKITSGDVAVIATKNDWIGAEDGAKVLEDQRTLTFGTDGESRYIDFDITLTALDKAVTFGDDKEGVMGIRVAGSLKPDAKLGGKLVNAKGDENQKAWGKKSPWVDYSGPVDGKGGETVGISFMNHPSSFRYPTNWHARTYGLCSANPFGLSFFEGKDKNGAYTIKPGESITLCYRFYFHKGDATSAKIADAFQKYAAEKK